MQHHRIGARLNPAPPSPRVRGLGLCDALLVELEPCQIAGAIDELEERRGPVTERFELARNRWEALAERERGADPDGLEQDMSRSAYALEALTKLRAQLPTPAHDEAVAVVGPAAIVSALVGASARNAADELAEVMRNPLGTDVALPSRGSSRGQATSAHDDPVRNSGG
jgi:hypothetical protein